MNECTALELMTILSGLPHISEKDLRSGALQSPPKLFSGLPSQQCLSVYEVSILYCIIVYTCLLILSTHPLNFNYILC